MALKSVVTTTSFAYAKAIIEAAETDSGNCCVLAIPARFLRTAPRLTWYLPFS